MHQSSLQKYIIDNKFDERENLSHWTAVKSLFKMTI